MPERLDRRLTTILAADFAEHSRLMRANEDGDPDQEFFADGVGEDMITRCPIPVRHRAPAECDLTRATSCSPLDLHVGQHNLCGLGARAACAEPDAPRVTITTLF
jgi:hypothetical protein